MMQRLAMSVLVAVVATAFTAVGLRATDYLVAVDGVCPSDMVPVQAVPGVLCVDKAEARAASLCPWSTLSGPQATADNIAAHTCTVVADGDHEPWRFVTREQAALLCARSEKRLPTAREWYQIALSSRLEGCNFTTNRPDPSIASSCVTSAGVMHMPGNLWEWVSDDVRDGAHDGTMLPPSGYVVAVDQAGVATVTGTTSDSLFGEDYVRFAASGLYGMVRGGYYGSGKDGGIYALQANVVPTFASAGIGFRCVR